MFGDDGREDMVHHGLECSGRISEPEKHDQRFEESVARLERCFVFVAFLDTDVIVPPSNIEFRVYVCSSKISNKVRDEG